MLDIALGFDFVEFDELQDLAIYRRFIWRKNVNYYYLLPLIRQANR